MIFLKTMHVVVALLLCTNIWADTLSTNQSPTNKSLINPNHPQQYTITKGDTLWRISNKFLGNSEKWQQLWENNPHIKNPHTLYIGDTLYFSGASRPQVIPSKHSAKNVKLKPRIRKYIIPEPIKTIPSDAILQFLTPSKIVSKKQLTDAPYIIGFKNGRDIASAGDKAYVKSITAPQSLRYTIYREGVKYISPINKEILGYEAEYIADAVIEKAGDIAVLTIIKSSREVNKGDRLIASDKSTIALNFLPHPPKKRISANIIHILGGDATQIGGRYSLVVLDKGSRDGIEVGHTINIYKDGNATNNYYKNNQVIQLSDTLTGTLMVVRSFERTSYALVLEATEVIRLFDKVKTL